MDIIFTPECDFIEAEPEYIRECLINQSCDDFEQIYSATQRFTEHVTDVVTSRHDIPADVRVMIERMKAYIEEAAETFDVIFAEQVGDA